MTHTTYNNTKSMLIVGSIVALSMVALTNPAAAYGGQQNHHMSVTSNDITVTNSNSATVSNTVVVGANTGYNSVAGGTSGKAGNGGNVHGNGTAGNGGTSGGSNNDGYIATGNAASLSAISNDINTNRTKITTNCGCQGKNGGDVTVNNQNNANIGNAVVAGSNTGYNGVTGGNTGAAGNGGETASHSWSKWNNHHMNNNGGATAGNGGNTGTSNNIGTILTGDSLSDSLVVNVVNRNITRIK
jgi:hypothetical protein